MARRIFLGVLLLGVFALLGYSQDVAIYAGHTNPGWFNEDEMLKQTDELVAAIKGKVKSVEVFKDDALDALAKWTENNTGDGELDILILMAGTTPSVLYPNPNKQPDGSRIEKFFEDGNLIINTGDYFAYCTYETGQRGQDNGPAGIQNILDCPDMTMWGDNTPMKPTPDGKKYLPTLEDFLSDRPFHVDELAVNPDLEVEAVFGAVDGDPNATRADPILIRDKVGGGRLFIVIQNAEPTFPTRGKLIEEFILNYVLPNLVTAVSPESKMAARWGDIKISF
ncbi:TPA: hypothetical protein EYP37_12900 [Candidatus Poribacteria bacterium]|nr:hypothetical protein [Candidatus Poribacteria bacterium]